MSNLKNPLVSVIIPLYNQERHFTSCIRSICCQSYSNLEIIVVNDASTDKSCSIARKWQAKDDRIIVIDKSKNEGTSKARLDGLRQSSGKYFFPVDSDDFLPKNAIERLVGLAEEKDVDVVLGSVTKVLGLIRSKNHYDYGDFPFYRVVKQPELFDNFYLGYFGKPCFSVMMNGRLYRMSAVTKALNNTELFSDEFPFMAEDQFFNMQLFPYLKSMYRTSENIYFYRYGGLSTSHFSPGYTDVLRYSDFRLKILDEKGLIDGYRYLYEDYAHCVYYHAQQLLEYKVVDKIGVIGFFRSEIETRSIAGRLIDYFSEIGAPNHGVQLIVNKDYEGMYNHAFTLMKKRTGSMKSRFVRFYYKMISLF